MEEAGVLPDWDTLQRQRIKNTYITKPIHFYHLKKERGSTNLSALPLLRPTLEREEKLLWELIWPQCQPVVHVQTGKFTARRHNASQQPNYREKHVKHREQVGLATVWSDTTVGSLQ